MSRKAVFLDRDGTLNKVMLLDGRPTPPREIKDFELLEGVDEAVTLLRSLDYLPIIVTNQPDYARGVSTLNQIETINDTIRKELGIEHIYICLHDDNENCFCRKPKPGLLIQAALELNIELSSSIMIGDRWRDIKAGQSAGCTCYFIDYGYDELSPVQPFFQVLSLLDAAKKIEGIYEK
jgi:D-glycero-D-manno-heptose 1,7-bisphosphate phosphatase